MPDFALRRPRFLLLLVALLARAIPFLAGTEHYGDAPVRIELGRRWAAHPHLWRGFAEAYQYGPLHLSLLGLAARLLPGPAFGARLVSLVAGLVSIALLYRLATRVAGARAGFGAALLLALSPLHVQASTTGASEAPFLALFLGALELLEQARERRALSRVAAAGLLLGAAGLVRYDGWLYVPLFALLFLAPRRQWREAALFCAVAALPAVLWMARNAQCTGDPLRPLHYIDEDHANLSRNAIAALGPVLFRLKCLVYWPAAVCLVATPLAGILALLGAARALVRRLPGWELAALGWIPAAYFTFRGAVLGNFWPMARFALVATVLSAPFAAAGLELFSARARRAVLAASLAFLVTTPVALAAASWGRDGTVAEWARPVSPISTVPPGIAQAADWLAGHAAADEVVLLDGVWDYLDIPLAFRANLREDQWVRVAWTDDFERRLALRAPSFAVLLYQGDLHRVTGGEGIDFTQARFRFRGLTFCEAQRFVYATVYRRCDFRR